MSDIWIRINHASTSDEFWHIDYQNGVAIKSSERPKYESVKKWDGSLTEFLLQHDIKPIEENEKTIKFKPAFTI